MFGLLKKQTKSENGTMSNPKFEVTVPCSSAWRIEKYQRMLKALSLHISPCFSREGQILKEYQ